MQGRVSLPQRPPAAGAELANAALQLVVDGVPRAAVPCRHGRKDIGHQSRGPRARILEKRVVGLRQADHAAQGGLRRVRGLAKALGLRVVGSRRVRPRRRLGRRVSDDGDQYSTLKVDNEAPSARSSKASPMTLSSSLPGPNARAISGSCCRGYAKEPPMCTPFSHTEPLADLSVVQRSDQLLDFDYDGRRSDPDLRAGVESGATFFFLFLFFFLSPPRPLGGVWPGEPHKLAPPDWTTASPRPGGRVQKPRTLWFSSADHHPSR